MSAFIDNHAHLLAVASGAPFPWGDSREPSAIGAWHREIASRDLSPMDVATGPADVDDLPRALDDALRWAASLGVAQITEAGMSDPAHLDALKTLRALGSLPLQVRILVASGLAERAMPARIGDEWLDVVGVKFYADGWLGTRTCALHTAFVDHPGNDGVLFQDASTLTRRMTPFADAGWRLATHAIGDRAIEAVCDAYEAVYSSDCAAAAPRIEHAQITNDDLIARIAALGIVACIQPSFGISDEAAARVALPPGTHAYAWTTMMRAGVRVISGSDYPIETLDPREGLRDLMTGSSICEAVPREAARALMGARWAD